MRAAPAVIGARVRTIGTNRAITIAKGPRCSKNAWASTRYFCLRNRASGLNIAVPTYRPMKYPTCPPRIAAIGMKTSSCHSWNSACPAAAVPAASMPATNSSVSPGSTGNSTPDSTKITTSSPTNAQAPKYPMSFIGSRKSGMSASCVAAAETAVVVMAPQDTGELLRGRCTGLSSALGSAMTTHKAVHVASANAHLTLVDVETTPPGPGQVRIAVSACGVCGTDHGFVSGGFPNMTWPLTLGHEIAGTVAELGQGVGGFAVGDRVAVGWFGGNCNKCIPCRKGKFMQCENGQVPSLHYPGGYAESVIAPATALARIPDELSFAEAAPMGC